MAITSEQARLNSTKHGKSYEAAYHNWYHYRNKGNTTLEEYLQLAEKCPKGKVMKFIDGRWEYLSRSDATRLQKMRKDNTSGYKNVYYQKRRGWWYWQLMVDGVNHQRVGFASAEEADRDITEYIRENRIRTSR